MDDSFDLPNSIGAMPLTIHQLTDVLWGEAQATSYLRLVYNGFDFGPCFCHISRASYL